MPAGLLSGNRLLRSAVRPTCSNWPFCHDYMAFTLDEPPQVGTCPSFCFVEMVIRKKPNVVGRQGWIRRTKKKLDSRLLYPWCQPKTAPPLARESPDVIKNNNCLQITRPRVLAHTALNNTVFLSRFKGIEDSNLKKKYDQNHRVGSTTEHSVVGEWQEGIGTAHKNGINTPFYIGVPGDGK